MKKFDKDKLVEYGRKIMIIVLLSMCFCIALIDAVLLLEVWPSYKIYFVIFPIASAICIKFVQFRKKIILISELFWACWITAIEFLVVLWFDVVKIDIKAKIIIYLVTVLFMIWEYRTRICNKNDEQIEEIVMQDNSLFSLYYINTEKVYEIAMLLNNKVVTSGFQENLKEELLEKQMNLGISSNNNYLKMIAGELGVSQNVLIQNSIKSKVLENFDVKTTKSNMLANIIDKAKIYSGLGGLHPGDLVLLKGASLELLNAEDSYGVIKLLLNGAFNDMKISSDNQDMKFEMNLSTIINSLLKDCVYELGCTVNDDKFLLTIPMTFENDFENSYNIFDLEVGGVTVVGIYRGKRKNKSRLTLQELFSNTSKERNTYGNEAYSLKKSSEISNDKCNNEEQNKQAEEYQEVIDIIAIIQEINPN